MSSARSILDGVLESIASDDAERAKPISAWCEQHLMHPRGSGPAAHDRAITPYWDHWLRIAQSRLQGRALDADPWAHRTEQIWLVTGNQLGKTMGFLLALWAWVCACEPRATGIVYPRLADLRRAQRSRARRLLELSPRLELLIPGGAAERERRLGQSLWDLATCPTYWLNGGAALDLRTMDLPLILADEFDGYPQNVEGEGSPLKLLADRQKTYPTERLLVGITTPSWVSGHGWQRLHAGSHERLLISCPDCGAHDWLNPEHLRAPEDATPDDIQLHDLARWHCRHCGTGLSTAHIRAAIAAACAADRFTAAGGWVPGRWEADDRSAGGGLWAPQAVVCDRTGRISTPATPATTVRSGQLGSLYSPFISLGAYMADQLRSAATSEPDRIAHANGWAGMPATAARDAVDETDLADADASADYPHGQCPAAACWIIVTFDQQGMVAERSWFPYVVRAWADNGESWLIEAGKVTGFDQASGLLRRQWLVGGQARGVDYASMDAANGSMMRTIRRWCAEEPRRRISLAMSGTLAPDHPLSWEQANAKNAARLCGLPIVYTGNAHLFRDELLEHMRRAPGRPAWRIPMDAPPFYRESLLSEERVMGRRVIRGRVVEALVWRPRTYQLPDGRTIERSDNHWWDCEVCQMALVTILGLGRRARATQATTAADFVARATGRR